jgi:non-heme chloroperoxidase
VTRGRRGSRQKIDIPVLVMHGSADRILPIKACGPRTHELISGSEYVVIDGADHGLCWTHADDVNRELLRFFK